MILSLIHIILIPVLSPLGIGIIRKVKARMQNRSGASVIQPYCDLWKLFHKDEVLSHEASWVFRGAPYIIFATTILIGAAIPLFAPQTGITPLGDFITIIYLFALGNFFLALAGMDTGSPFGGFGSSREMTIAALSEGGILFSLLATAILGGTSDLGEISQRLSDLAFASWVPALIAFCGFLLVLLSENARYPFDNPATHLELTMVHEAMILEYSGKRLALMEWASANKLLAFIAIGVNVFLPFGIATELSVAAVTAGIFWFLLKALAVFVGIAVLESSIAKIRFFRIPDLLFTSLILGIVAVFMSLVEK